MNTTPTRLLRLARELAYAGTAPALRVTKFEPDDSEGMRRHVREHGWVIVRGVFSPDEVMQMREGVLRSKAEHRDGELLSNPHFRPVLLDARFLKIVRAIVGPKPVYFGDSNWSADYYPGTIGFHKDNPDKERETTPDWQSEYTIYRFGLYLQDCTNYSGGLCLRDKSHLGVSVNHGQSFAAPSLPGDIVAWSLRTSHSGYATRLRAAPRVFVPLQVVARIAASEQGYRAPALLFRGLEFPDRLALFASFGIRDHHLDRYLRYLKTRQYFVRAIQESAWPAGVSDEARSAGVDLLSLHNEVSALDVSKLNRDHVPLDP